MARVGVGRLARVIVVGAAVVLPSSLIASIAFDAGHQGVALGHSSPTSVQQAGAWPVAAGQQLFSANPESGNGSDSTTDGTAQQLQQRVVIPVNDSTSTTEAGATTTTTSPSPTSSETPPETAHVLGTAQTPIPPPAVAVPAKTNYTG